MASAFTNAGKNTMLDQLGSVGGFAAVHNVDAPTDNTTEPSGGSPAYARKAITFAAASGGSKALNGTLPTFDIPAGFTVKSVAIWSLVTGGTLYGYWDVTDEVYAGQGTYAASSGSISL